MFITKYMIQLPEIKLDEKVLICEGIYNQVYLIHKDDTEVFINSTVTKFLSSYHRNMKYVRNVEKPCLSSKLIPIKIEEKNAIQLEVIARTYKLNSKMILSLIINEALKSTFPFSKQAEDIKKHIRKKSKLY